MNIDRARELRREMTEAEQFLWKRLRHRQLLGMKFRRQVPIGSFIADFCCLERRLIVELDGGQHVDEEAYDVGRTDWLQSQGFRVLRFWNHEVFKETQVILDAIVEALEEAMPLTKSPRRKERSRMEEPSVKTGPSVKAEPPRQAEPPPRHSPARGEGVKCDTRSQHRSGFTLVELLISIAIIGILAALGAAAYIRSMAGAKVKSTQAVIENLNSGLQERLEIFRAVKIDPKTMLALAQARPTDPTNPGSPAYRRAEVLLRMSFSQSLFPQQFWDIAPYLMDSSGNPDPPAVTMKEVDPAAGGALLREFAKSMRLSDTQMLSSYLDNANNTTWNASFFPNPSNTTPSMLHDTETESTECLYLILNWAPEGTSITSASIPAQFKADTDGDGLMEFVDAWGRPLKFYRSPTDFYAYLIDVVREMPDPGIAANSLDPNGLLLDPYWVNGPGVPNNRKKFEGLGLARLHDAYQPPSVVGGPRDAATNPQPDVPRAYPTNPMIVSAGPDGRFGFWTPYSASEGTTTKRDPHPITDGGAGSGRFLHFRCARVDPLEVEFVADNITNLNITGSRGN